MAQWLRAHGFNPQHQKESPWFSTYEVPIWISNKPFKNLKIKVKATEGLIGWNLAPEGGALDELKQEEW